LGDVATFGVSNTPAISLSASIQAALTFSSGASPYTITVPSGDVLTITGAGITNNSGVTQNFLSMGQVLSTGHILITGNASAGSGNVFTAAGFLLSSGTVELLDSATAGDCTFNASYGLVKFDDDSSADHATLIASAFQQDQAEGVIQLFGNSTGGVARVILNGGGRGQYNGQLDLRSHYPNPNVTIGSLEGTGGVLLWGGGDFGINLIVGSNNLSTRFDGFITGSNFGFGALTKVGSGTLTLTNGLNTHGQGTFVLGGTLMVRNSSGSATGYGPVEVSRGQLAGSGIMSGPVTIGKGHGHGAFIAPGNRMTLGTLTTQGLLTLNADATYDCALNSSRVMSDEIVANGVSLSAGPIMITDNGTATLTPGTSFTLISNTSATAITGTFNNLPDGGMITLGNNTFQANYEGGDGNDLTLTVVQ